MLKINELSRLYLGVKGENNSRTIEIDMSAWASIYPNATAVILHKRSGDQAKELTGATYDSETKVLQWKTSSTDTFYDGFGLAEVRMVENNVVKKTKDAITTVTASSITTASGDVLESNYQAFLNAVTAQATAAGTAKTGAETAQGYAEAAQAAAEAAILLAPYIDETTGNWFVWDWDDEEYKDTGVHAKGDKGDPGSTSIDDTAGAGDTDVVWSADKSATENSSLLNAISEKDTYVTPEEFGAKGDGTTDDTTAVQAALDYGRTNRVSVRGYKRYKTSSPLTISGTYRDVFLNVVSYTGNECGLIVQGSHHDIRVMQLYCSNGGGVVYKADSGNISWVNFQANRVFAKGHAVDLQISNSRWILYNTFNIRAIKSDTGNCYNGSAEHVGENVFYNSSCTCENGWAIYKVGGRFYNFTLEADVLNGIYAISGSIYVGFRYREMTDKLIYRINGADPTALGGTLIKFDGLYKTPVKFVAEDVIPYEAVDVSDMTTLDDLQQGVTASDITSLTRFSVIDAPIRYGNWDTQNGNFVVGKQMLVTGGKKICIPAFETEYTITESDFDMRDAQVALDNAKPYPTKMIIGVNNCVIHLPTSYCPYGYSEFVVDQTDYSCTIYDANDSTTPIFNGGQLGSGVYRLRAYCDSLDNAVTEIMPQKIMNINDTENYEWEITKISDVLNYVTPEMYGAVGDGVTDDSEAMQAAVNAGYEISLGDNKTYYIPSMITVAHDVHLYGGKNTVIKTETQENGKINTIFDITGTLKKTTTLTTDYTSSGNTYNAGNKFTLADMDGISVGDIMIVKATDQYYSYSRQYYYLGATLLIGDIYNGHIYTCGSMPFDIELTGNVSVEIYSAPTAIIENLHFVADHEYVRHWDGYFIRLQYCKNSVIRNCDMTMMDNGVFIGYCVNMIIDGLNMSKCKAAEDEYLSDGYSIYICSSTGTIIRRLYAICGQSCISLSGYTPNIDTYIKECNITPECRLNALGSHPNCYNTVIEDCVSGGIDIAGTATVNRCRFIRNNRTSGEGGINFSGSHDERFAQFRVYNCEFDSVSKLTLSTQSPQTPIQPIDSVIGLVEISDCTGGYLLDGSSTSTFILSVTVNQLTLKNWKNCDRFIRYDNGNKINKMLVDNCSFVHKYWMTDQNNDHGIITANIGYLDYKSNDPDEHILSVDRQTKAEKHVLPKKTVIHLSSNNNSAKFVVCGNNLIFDDLTDYFIGSVSGSVGENLVRTPASGSSVPSLAKNGNGSFVYTQKSNTTRYSFVPYYMFYVKELSDITMSAKLKNTGNTDGASFRGYMCAVDCKTGKVALSNATSSTAATAEGATAQQTRRVSADTVVFCYYSCSTAISDSETTFEDMSVVVNPVFAPATVDESEFVAVRRTGDGDLLAVEGINNIMSSELNFDVKFIADYINNPM